MRVPSSPWEPLYNFFCLPLLMLKILQEEEKEKEGKPVNVHQCWSGEKSHNNSVVSVIIILQLVHKSHFCVSFTGNVCGAVSPLWIYNLSVLLFWAAPSFPLCIASWDNSVRQQHTDFYSYFLLKLPVAADTHWGTSDIKPNAVRQCGMFPLWPAGGNTGQHRARLETIKPCGVHFNSSSYLEPEYMNTWMNAGCSVSIYLWCIHVLLCTFET